MADADEIRQRVKERAEEAIDEELGRDTDDDTDDEDFLNAAEIASRGWDLGDYNSFFADCREDGYDASACGEMWSAMKDDGATGGRETQPIADEHGDVEDDVIVVDDDHDASMLAVQYLADPISEDRVSVATVESEPAQNMMEAVDDPPPIPAHYEVTEGGVRVGDLEELIQSQSV